ncbi:MAG: serine/threonine protein kinase, partial [bacterium]
MNHDRANPSDARLDPPGGWTILDALGEDPAGRRLAAQSGDGHRFQVVKPHEDDQSSLAFRERLKAKAARAKAIHSDWLVPTLGYTQDADTLFLAEAEMDGVSLAELAGSRRRLDRDAVFEVGECVARGLRELHRHGLVHGWIRPDAVLVTEDNALLRGCGLEHPKGETARPPTFMSPEQLSDDRSLRPQSDFFSLGSTLFAAIVGRGPFVGETDADVADAIRNGRPTFPSADEARLNRNQRLFFAKMLAAEPDRRPRSADELIADLTALRQGEPIERVTEMPPEPERRKPARKPKKKRRRRLLLRLGAVAAMLAITLVVALLGSSRDPGEMSGPDAAPEAEQETSAPEDGEPSEAAKKEQREAREKQAGDAYHQAVRFAVEHPLKHDEVIA